MKAPARATLSPKGRGRYESVGGLVCRNQGEAFGAGLEDVFGASAIISLKFSMKRAARASYFLKYSSRLGQVPAGSRMSEGTPSQRGGDLKAEDGVFLILDFG